MDEITTAQRGRWHPTVSHHQSLSWGAEETTWRGFSLRFWSWLPSKRGLLIQIIDSTPEECRYPNPLWDISSEQVCSLPNSQWYRNFDILRKRCSAESGRWLQTPLNKRRERSHGHYCACRYCQDIHCRSVLGESKATEDFPAESGSQKTSVYSYF